MINRTNQVMSQYNEVKNSDINTIHTHIATLLPKIGICVLYDIIYVEHEGLEGAVETQRLNFEEQLGMLQDQLNTTVGETRRQMAALRATPYVYFIVDQS